MIAERLNGKFDPFSILKKKKSPLSNQNQEEGGGERGNKNGADDVFSDHRNYPPPPHSSTGFEDGGGINGYFSPAPYNVRPTSSSYHHHHHNQQHSYSPLFYSQQAEVPGYFDGTQPSPPPPIPVPTFSGETAPEKETSYFGRIKYCYDSYFTFQNFLILTILFLIIFCFSIYVYRMIKKQISWPRYSLIKLETPPTVSTTTITSFSDPASSPSSQEENPESMSTTKASSSVLSETVHKTPLLLSRPFNSEAPGDYYGTVSVTKSKSAKLTVSSAHYFEVVIYTYPGWKVVYAETNINEFPFDFLDEGTYTVVVFSVDSVIGELEITKNTNRLKPPPRFHRITSQDVAQKRDEALLRIVDSLSPKGTIQAIRIISSPFTVWPGSVYTRVETLYAVVPEETVAIFGTFPSFGMIVEGADEHLGSLAHEGNSSAVYRIVSKPHETGNYRFVSMTIVYPDISLESPVPVSPTCALFIYTSPTLK